MSGPDWTECLHRPTLCGEKEEHRRGAGAVDMGEVLRERRMRQDAFQQSPQPSPPPAEAAAPAASPPLFSEVVRRRGLVFSSYWQVVNEPYAGAGDVVVVRSPSDYFVLRPVRRADVWVEAGERFSIAGHAERRLCIYGFVLSRDIDRIAAELASGRHALVAACDPRAVVRPPRREELYAIWRYEGYVVNTSPAKMALIRLDPAKKPKFAVDFLKSGCPIYSHYLNQILQKAGIPVQLTC